MKITKFGHCCLLIEISTKLDSGEKGVRILTDPGIYTSQQNDIKNIDIVLITHEHSDHFHIESVKKILENNPTTKIITNSSVNALLYKEGIVGAKIIEDGENSDADGILIEGFGKEHALMHTSITPVQNTGYFIENKFFYPGDAFINPGKEVPILALPVAGPWMRLLEAIDYALLIKPKICFPVHESILKSPGSVHLIPPKILEPEGIKFEVLEINKETEF